MERYMKNNSKTPRDVILGKKINRETVYYTALFGAATITALILLFIAYSQGNKELKIYSYVLAPLFFAATAVSARYTCFTKDRIHAQDGVLVIKTFFRTRKLKIAKIEKLTALKSGDDKRTSVKITYLGKVLNYKFKNITKEEVAHLRRTTSKY